jgi:hypothetical protein
MLLSIPRELVLSIVSYLEDTYLLRFSQVNRVSHGIVSSVLDGGMLAYRRSRTAGRLYLAHAHHPAAAQRTNIVKALMHGQLLLLITFDGVSSVVRMPGGATLFERKDVVDAAIDTTPDYIVLAYIMHGSLWLHCSHIHRPLVVWDEHTGLKASKIDELRLTLSVEKIPSSISIVYKDDEWYCLKGSCSLYHGVKVSKHSYNGNYTAPPVNVKSIVRYTNATYVLYRDGRLVRHDRSREDLVAVGVLSMFKGSPLTYIVAE